MSEPTGRTSAIRYLSPAESWYARLGAYVGYGMEVRGHLDVDALSAALTSVRHAYPVLAARLKSVDGGHLLVGTTGPLPDVGVVDGNPSESLTGFDVDPHDALSAVHVVRDGDRAVVTLVIHHAIADGHHGVAVLEAFWSGYTDIVHGDPPDLGIHGYPDSVEKILSDRGIGHFEYSDPPAESPVEPGADIDDELPTLTNPLVRCDVDTADLLELCHRTNITLNALVSAAIIQAEASERQRPINAIPYYITVDMRDRLTPPVSRPAGTNVISFVGFTATDDTDTDLIGLARAVATVLPDALEERRTIRRTALEISGFFDGLTAPSTPGSVLTTNLGAIPELRSPKELGFEGFRGSLYNKLQDPELLSPSQSESMYLYIIYSFSGTTTIEAIVGYPSQHESARRKIATLKSTLDAAPNAG